MRRAACVVFLASLPFSSFARYLSSLLERLMRAAIIVFQSRVNIVVSLGRTSDNARSLSARPSVIAWRNRVYEIACPRPRPSCVEWHCRSRPQRRRGQSCHVCCARRRPRPRPPFVTALQRSMGLSGIADLLSPLISSADLRSTHHGIVSRTNDHFCGVFEIGRWWGGREGEGLVKWRWR